MSSSMSDEDIAKAAELLARFEPGFLPYPVFEQIARLVALPILEFVPLRAHNGVIEVLLIARPEDDAYWPGLLHTPGTVIRATDVHTEDMQNWPAIDRILHDELQDTEVGAPRYVGSILHNSKRGAEQAQLYWVEVIGEPKVGNFYNVKALPDGLIDSQVAFIVEAARQFQQR
ncbi:MAG: hypothetical protein JWN38_726 [Candidatus Saccharibacteria bacterium]|nr:hypothetical protein [Candidatus Saccharibacteria bacterium]